jgi:hypothetical protein
MRRTCASGWPGRTWRRPFDKLRVTAFDKYRVTVFDKLRVTVFDKLRVMAFARRARRRSGRCR